MPYHSFDIKKTARYFTIGPAFADSKGILIVLHGYGQLPGFFIKRFQPIADDGWAIVAPEGLHRFYLEGTQGRVGASWMTKEARQDDILDNVHYLDSLATELQLNRQRPVLLGFSQGVATASRWAAMGKITFSRLIMWSGVFPPDYPWTSGTEQMRAMQIDVVYGTEDVFFDDTLLKTTAAVLDANAVPFTAYSFAGGHAIDTDLLHRLLN